MQGISGFSRTRGYMKFLHFQWSFECSHLLTSLCLPSKYDPIRNCTAPLRKALTYTTLRANTPGDELIFLPRKNTLTFHANHLLRSLRDDLHEMFKDNFRVKNKENISKCCLFNILLNILSIEVNLILFIIGYEGLSVYSLFTKGKYIATRTSKISIPLVVKGLHLTR